MQHRRQPLPAYSGATTLRHDDDKHAKHLHARTRKLWFAAAVVGIVVLVMGARALLLPSLVEVEVTHSRTTDPARPQYVHPLDDRSATRRAVEASENRYAITKMMWQSGARRRSVERRGERRKRAMSALRKRKGRSEKMQREERFRRAFIQPSMLCIQCYKVYEVRCGYRFPSRS